MEYSIKYHNLNVEVSAMEFPYNLLYGNCMRGPRHFTQSFNFDNYQLEKCMDRRNKLPLCDLTWET